MRRTATRAHRAGSWHRTHDAHLFGNAIDLFGVAQAEGFQLDSHPTPGAMVVYGSAYGAFGHIATVRAVQGRPL